jgi:hypothetical protein
MGEKSKEVKMNVSSKEEQKKLTYEQLEQVAGNLQRQCQQMYDQLREAQNVINNFNEVEMLLYILDKSEYFKAEFTDRCAAKIQEVITKALDASEKREEEDSKKN